MKTIKNAFALLSFLFLFHSCNSDDNNNGVDNEKPVIDFTVENAFPTSCATVTKGQSFIFKARFTDNLELGSYSLDIHNNFNHHSHDTEVASCNMEPVKTPVNPFTRISTHTIEEGLIEYIAQQEITIPEDIDPGDYHFMIKLTDKQGWSSMKGISFKITE